MADPLAVVAVIAGDALMIPDTRGINTARRLDDSGTCCCKYVGFQWCMENLDSALHICAQTSNPPEELGIRQTVFLFLGTLFWNCNKSLKMKRSLVKHFQN